MKKKILLFFVAVSVSVAQIDTTMSNGYFADTLKAGKMDFLITPDYSYNSNFTISAFTETGNDTLFVSTFSRDGTQESRKVLLLLSSGLPVSSAITDSIKKEYLIYDPMILKMRLKTNGNNTTIFTVSRK